MCRPQSLDPGRSEVPPRLGGESSLLVASMIEPRVMSIRCQMPVQEIGKRFACFLQLVAQGQGCAATAVFFAAPCFRLLGVVTSKMQLRRAVDSIEYPIRNHRMEMRLWHSTKGGNGLMDGNFIGLVGCDVLHPLLESLAHLCMG
ncbi:hypothetical protein ASF11_13035 [Acidovorax sp. Leaf76]|nr:hypothetical protein ASF11_13035 [Acidovorax sp. Leaf76]KQS29456.1 hypothetical protein ASG27_14865 [Acidovorax sp. Leaf191]